MSVYKRGSRWYAYVTIGGRRTRRSAGTRAAAVALEATLRRRADVPARGLEDALARHLDGAAQHLRAYGSRLSVARQIRPYLVGRTLSEAPQAAEAMIRAWSGSLSIATINRRLALLRRLCYLAHDWGWTDVAVGRRIKLLPGEQARHVYLTAAQVRALAAACTDRAVADAVRLAAYTGLRRGELLRLQAEHYRDGWLVVERTKAGRPRMVPVPSQVRAICRRLPLPLTEHSLRVGFEAARAAAGLPGLRYHDLRHTYASLLVAAGTPLRTVGELLGHSTPAVTARYAHLAPEHLREAVDRALAPQSRHRAPRRSA